MRNLTFYTADTKFDFGKYKGDTLNGILNTDPEYLKWCVDNVDWFCVEEEILDEIFYNHTNIMITDEWIIELNDCLLDKIKIISRTINSNKLEKFDKIILHEYNDNDCNYDRDDWMDDMRDNWLAYAAGTDDLETMNEVYWNLD